MTRILLTALLLLALAPAAANAQPARGGNWYWSTERAEWALETFEEGVAVGSDGASCRGKGKRLRRHLYHRFWCETFSEEGYYGSGTLHVRGRRLNAYYFDWD